MTADSRPGQAPMAYPTGIICPNCHCSFDWTNDRCLHCDWRHSWIQDIPCFLSTRDNVESQFKEYIDNYDQISLLDLEKSLQHKAYLTIMSKRFFCDVESYCDGVTGKNVCELGVGLGDFFRRVLEHKAATVTGVDISIHYLKHLPAAPNTLRMIANAENVPFANQFDIIVASDIMEHVLNMPDFLASSNRALKPEGRLILKVPYQENLMQYSRLMGCPHQFVHLRSFSRGSIRSTIENAGFRIDRFLLDGFVPYMSRPWISCNPVFRKLFYWWLQWYCHEEDKSDVARISRLIGPILMKPVEMTVFCQKTKDLQLT